MAKKKKITGSAEAPKKQENAAANTSARKMQSDTRPAWLAGAWLMLIFGLFPLIFTDRYFNMLETKLVTFVTVSLLLIVCMGVVYLDGGRQFKPFGDRSDMNRADWAVLAFFGFSLLATLLSGKFMYQALTGIDGRYVGFLYIVLITLVYFLVSRNLEYSKKYLTVFLAVGLAVCLLGYSDFYNLDLLNFRAEMLPEQYGMFMSTFGNINTYTVYVALVVAVSGTLFALSEEKTGRIGFYYLVYLVSTLALITGASDNAYLSLAGLFGALPFAAFRSSKSRARYFLLLSTLILAISYISGVSVSMAGKVLPLYGLFRVLGGIRFLPYLGAGLCIVSLALLYRERNKEITESTHAKRWIRGYTAVLCLSLLAFIAVFAYANSLPYETVKEKFGGLADYLKFRDEWGTFRGYVWRAGIDEYLHLPILNRIFGSGPDTFVSYMVTHRWNEMNYIAGQYYDSAHNEYIQYLFTVGPFGLLAHLSILVFSVKAAFQKARALNEKRDGSLPRANSAYLYAIGVAIVCYACQAFVNINVPVAAPVFWGLIALGRAAE